jgi:chemotaxis family two-component system response regulator Rcp1
MLDPPRKPAVEVLLVEDNRSDSDLMVEELGKSPLGVRIAVVEDGEEAIDYLRRRGQHAQATRPDLVLLDLHLPRKSGHEVLAEIKEDDDLRLIPVIILTSAASDEPIQHAYDLHANCCVRKPADLDEFAVAIGKIEHFWTHVASRLRRASSA